MFKKPIEQQILDELLGGEFKGLEVALMWKASCHYIASANLATNVVTLNLWFREAMRAKQGILLKILRHELLHIELKEPDYSLRFQQTAHVRGIVWDRSDMDYINQALKSRRNPIRSSGYIRYAFMPGVSMTLTMDGKTLASTKPYMVATS